jgi:hypothetical protein
VKKVGATIKVCPMPCTWERREMTPFVGKRHNSTKHLDPSVRPVGVALSPKTTYCPALNLWNQEGQRCHGHYVHETGGWVSAAEQLKTGSGHSNPVPKLRAAIAMVSKGPKATYFSFLCFKRMQRASRGAASRPSFTDSSVVFTLPTHKFYTVNFLSIYLKRERKLLPFHW